MFSWLPITTHSASGGAPQRSSGVPDQATGQLGSKQPSSTAEAGVTAEATDAEKRSERRRVR